MSQWQVQVFASVNAMINPQKVREGLQIKIRFFWECFPKYGSVGWLSPKSPPNQTPKKQITPKITFLNPNFTFRVPKSHKNPGVGVWVQRFWKVYQKKTFFREVLKKTVFLRSG